MDLSYRHEIDEFLIDFDNLSSMDIDNESYLSESSDGDNAPEENYGRFCRRERLIPFYRTRKDIFTHFDDEKLIRNLRFNRASIEHILGIQKTSFIVNSAMTLMILSLYRLN